MKPIAKTHIDRLKRMVKRMDDKEKWLQKKFGHEVFPRSQRSVDLKEAETLRKVIAHLEAQQQIKP